MSSQIEAQITALIAATLNVDQAMVDRDAHFADDLAADSLDTVALILAIEDRFGIDIHDEDAAEILTVEQIIDYVTVALATKETVRGRSNSQRTVALR
jgi:acyl carrier protein